MEIQLKFYRLFVCFFVCLFFCLFGWLVVCLFVWLVGFLCVFVFSAFVELKTHLFPRGFVLDIVLAMASRPYFLDLIFFVADFLLLSVLSVISACVGASN